MSRAGIPTGIPTVASPEVLRQEFSYYHDDDLGYYIVEQRDKITGKYIQFICSCFQAVHAGAIVVMLNRYSSK